VSNDHKRYICRIVNAEGEPHEPEIVYPSLGCYFESHEDAAESFAAKMLERDMKADANDAPSDYGLYHGCCYTIDVRRPHEQGWRRYKLTMRVVVQFEVTKQGEVWE